MPISTTESELKSAQTYIDKSEISFEQFLSALTMTAHEFYKVGKSDGNGKTVPPGRTVRGLLGVAWRCGSRV